MKNLTAKLTIFIFLVSGSFSLIASEVSNHQSRTVDGRFGTGCMQWIGDSSRDICYVSFYRIIATPERYDKKLIKLSGFLIKMFDQYIIFPSRDSYESGVDLDGIRVMNSDSVPKSLAQKASKGLFPVTVIGVFDAKYGGDGNSPLMLLGSLKDVEVVKYAPRVNSGESGNHLW